MTRSLHEDVWSEIIHSPEDSISRISVVTDRRKLVDGLAAVLRYQNLQVAEHLEAVGILAARAAAAMHLDADSVERVTLAARLHDIGHHAISDGVFRKRGTLTKGERELLRAHPRLSEEIVHGFPTLSTFAHIVRAHHEFWNGRGYPDKLSGNDIPIESRIIAVADAFHAMTIPVPYAKPRAPRDALNELQRCAGFQFDPASVEGFRGAMADVSSSRRV